MKTSVMVPVLLSGGLSYTAYVTSLNPLAWYRLTETSGVTAVNSVTPGTLDASIGGTTTLGQTGYFGLNEAYGYDGSTSILTVANHASIQGLPNITIMGLMKLNSYGELGSGRLFQKTNEALLAPTGGGLNVFAGYSTTDVNETIAAGIFPLSVWAWSVYRLSSTTKKVDAFINKTKYTSSGTGDGTRDSNTNPLEIGNAAGGVRTIDGLLDEFILWNRALTDSEINRVITSSGVA